MAYVAIAATTAIGASLAERDYALPFGLAVGAGLAAAFLAAGLQEPQRPPGGGGAWAAPSPRHCASSAVTGSSWR